MNIKYVNNVNYINVLTVLKIIYKCLIKMNQMYLKTKTKSYKIPQLTKIYIKKILIKYLAQIHFLIVHYNPLIMLIITMKINIMSNKII